MESNDSTSSDKIEYDYTEESKVLSLITRHLISTVDEPSIRHLFELEQRYMLSADYKRHFVHKDSTSLRAQCMMWILDVQAYYDLSVESTLLAVNYCDRFLSLRPNRPFKESMMYQLVSVVCMFLSVKTKEKMKYSLRAVLSKLKPTYLFDRVLVRETEVMVLKQLQWDLRSVTPIDFIPYFMSQLPQNPLDIHAKEVSDIASYLLLDTISIPCFLEFSPSVVGAAAVLGASIPYCIASYDQVLFDRVDQETVRRCLAEMSVHAGKSYESKILMTP